MIKAIHPATGRKGEFSERAWELLPADKDGWQVQVPEEVASAIDEKKKGRAADKTSDKKSAKKGTEVDKVNTEETAGEGDPADEETAGEGDPADEETAL